MATMQRHPSTPLGKRTARRTMHVPPFQGCAWRAQVRTYPEIMQTLQRTPRGKKPERSTISQPLASVAIVPIAHNAPLAPAIPSRQVAAIHQRSVTTEEEDEYPMAHGRICMIQEGRPSNRQQKQVSRQVFLAAT